MTRHLKEKHHYDPVASGVAKNRQLDGSTVDTAFRRGAEAKIATEKQRREDLLATGLNQATLEYLYTQWIVECDLPFNQVTHKPFRAFLEYISPPANKILPNAAATVEKHAFELFAEGKRRLRHIMLSALSGIHITCDIWTSPNHLGILAVVAHFTAESLERRKITLAIKELQGVHSGENQATVLLQVLGDYGIVGRLGYFVMDNTYSNDTSINIISEALLKNHGVDYNPHQHRLRCLGHVINLSAQAFLFGKAVDDYEYPEETYISPSDEQLRQWRRLGPLGKLHNINTYIWEALSAFNISKQLVVALYLTETMGLAGILGTRCWTGPFGRRSLQSFSLRVRKTPFLRISCLRRTGRHYYKSVTFYYAFMRQPKSQKVDKQHWMTYLYQWIFYWSALRKPRLHLLTMTHSENQSKLAIRRC